MERATKSEIGLWVLGAVLIAAALAIFGARAAEGQKPKNELLVEAAWRAFSSGDYAGAILRCNELVDEFRPAADREQSSLEQRNLPAPPIGPPKESEKKAVFERGLLNDVGTCLFIIGRSAESQGKQDIARDSYTKAKKYTYARAWDPKGWFWSPAQAAADRLAGMK